MLQYLQGSCLSLFCPIVRRKYKPKNLFVLGVNMWLELELYTKQQSGCELQILLPDPTQLQLSGNCPWLLVALCCND